MPPISTNPRPRLPSSGYGINLTRTSLTLQVGQMTPIQAGGSFVFVESSQGQSFTLQFGQANSMQCKEGFELETENPFPSINVTNNISGVILTVVIWTGTEGVNYFPVAASNSVKDAATYFRGNGGAGGNADLNLADGANTAYNGVDAATGKTRRFAIVRNTSANTICLLDANGVRMATLKTTEPPYTVVGSGSFTVQNVVGSGASTYQILETFYV